MNTVIPATIVISSYNYARYLPQCIDSALAQTYPRTEVIVVDDGSTDDSREIIKSYGCRIKPVFKSNGGQASAFNAGFAQASGQVVAFLDSDDVLLPTAIEQAASFFADPEVAKCHWPLLAIDPNGKPTGAVIPPIPLAEGDLRDHLLQHGHDSYSWPPTSGNAWSRAFLSEAMPIPEHEYRTCPDLYLSSIVPIYGTIAKIDSPQGCWRLHGENHSWNEPLEIRLDRMIVRSNHRFDEVARRLRARNIQVDPEAWKNESRWHKSLLAVREMASLIPVGDKYIFVDDAQLSDHQHGQDAVVEGRQAVPFLERDGQYWGPPLDDETAIRELERLHAAGAKYLVFAWPAFWWLTHYAGFLQYLRGRYRVLLENQRLVAFDLLTPAEMDSK
jgi:glycosyltransferase involved in cell wall biosynthesis